MQKKEMPMSEEMIGVSDCKAKTITLNESYSRGKPAKYYMALLEDAAKKGYDCILLLDGTDVIRKMTKAI